MSLGELRPPPQLCELCQHTGPRTCGTCGGIEGDPAGGLGPCRWCVDRLGEATELPPLGATNDPPTAALGQLDNIQPPASPLPPSDG